MPIWIGNIKTTLPVALDDSALDYSNFYDPKFGAFTYEETYGHGGEYRKTATFGLIDSVENISGGFTVPKVGQIVEFYQNANKVNLIFRGVIVKDPVVGHGTYSDANRNPIPVLVYSFECEGLYSYTVDFDIITARYISRKAGDILYDVLSNKGDNPPKWLNLNPTLNFGTNNPNHPVIALANFINRKRSSIIAEIVRTTGWEFFVSENGTAYFYDPTQGTPFGLFTIDDTLAELSRTYNEQSLKVESTDRDLLNEATIIGDETQGRKVTEYFQGNKVTGDFPLADLPFGLNTSDLLIDSFTGNNINLAIWQTISPTQINKPLLGMTQSLGRLQINQTLTETMLSVDVFPREDFIEARISEIEFQNIGGSLIIGFHNGNNSGVQDLTYNLHSVEFNGGTIWIREGGTRTSTTFSYLTNLARGSNVYAIRIRLKVDGGALYFIQGGVFGTLGGRSWTKLTETSSSSQSYFGFSIRSENGTQATIIRSFVTRTTQVRVQVTESTGPRELVVGTANSQDASIEAFVDESAGNAMLHFYASDNTALDTRPLGKVQVDYYGVGQVRESIFDQSSIARMKAQSGLVPRGDTGLRRSLFPNDPMPKRDIDGLRLGVQVIKDRAAKHYRGMFKTSSEIPINGTRNRPLAGSQLSLKLTRYGAQFTSTEVITRVSGRNAGYAMDAWGVATQEFFEYDVEFGGLFNFTEQQLYLKRSQKIVIDDRTPLEPIRRSEVTTALNTRLGITNNVVGTYGDTAINLSWMADSASGRVSTEVRLDEAFGTPGAGLIFTGAGTSTSVTPDQSTPNGYILPKRRRYVFYLREKDNAGNYSYRSTICTVHNPAPIPRPFKEVQNRLGGSVNLAFQSEYESDVQKRRVYISKDPNFDPTTAYAYCDVGTTITDYDVMSPGPDLYVRYSLFDPWTTLFRDEIYTGERMVRVTTDKASPSQVRNLKCFSRWGTCTDQDANCTSGTIPGLPSNVVRATWNPPSGNIDSLFGYLVYAASAVNQFPDPIQLQNFYVDARFCSNQISAYANAGRTPVSWGVNQYKGMAIGIVTDPATSGNLPDINVGTRGVYITTNTAAGICTIDRPFGRKDGLYQAFIIRVTIDVLPPEQAQFIWFPSVSVNGSLPTVSTADFELPGQKLYIKVIAINNWGSTGKIVGPCEARYATDEIQGSSIDMTINQKCFTTPLAQAGPPQNFSVLPGTGWGDVYAEWMPPSAGGGSANYQIAWSSTPNFLGGGDGMKNLGNQLYTPIYIGQNRAFYFKIRAQVSGGLTRWIDPCGNVTDCLSG